MKPVEEAIELKKRVNSALLSMGKFDEFERTIKESEVKFRYESIIGILLMASNDISELIADWKQQGI